MQRPWKPANWKRNYCNRPGSFRWGRWPLAWRTRSTTNSDLALAVSQNAFRPDLFYRLNTFTIHLPPLRKRPEDIPNLARHFLQNYAGEMHKTIRDLSPEAETALMAHPFPGNVRELRNTIERAAILCKGERLTIHDLQFGPPMHFPSNAPPSLAQIENLNLNDRERDLIEEALRRTQGNQIRAASLLGLSRDALRRRLQRYGLS